MSEFVEDKVVDYSQRGAVAVITMTRAAYRNAQNNRMTYELDDAFYRASEDESVKVVVLAGEGKHFSAGHDIGTPGRDMDVHFARRAVASSRVVYESDLISGTGVS